MTSYTINLHYLEVCFAVGQLWGHVTSSKVTKGFWPITPYRNKIQTRGWSHCVQLVKTHRMICMMTLKSRDLEVKRPYATWPEVNLWPWLLKVNTYIFRCGLTRELRWYSKFWPSLITSKVIRKKTVIASRAANLAILTPVTPESTSKMRQMRHRHTSLLNLKLTRNITENPDRKLTPAKLPHTPGQITLLVGQFGRLADLCNTSQFQYK